jgi:hypothetical protein
MLVADDTPLCSSRRGRLDCHGSSQYRKAAEVLDAQLYAGQPDTVDRNARATVAAHLARPATRPQIIEPMRRLGIMSRRSIPAGNAGSEFAAGSYDPNVSTPGARHLVPCVLSERSSDDFPAE